MPADDRITTSATAVPASIPPPPQHRIALCIGNSAYANSPLTNPVNDATDFSDYLRRQLAFTADVACDADRRDMKLSFDRLLSAIQPSSVVVLFFAGHGYEVDGVNYLLPVMDCGAITDADIEDSGVSAQWMQKKVWERKPAFLLFILDCCRNNPFRGIRSTGDGLAEMEPLGSLLLYACAPGRTARDGVDKSRNSPLTTHLMRHLHCGERTLVSAQSGQGGVHFHRTRTEAVDALRHDGRVPLR